MLCTLDYAREEDRPPMTIDRDRQADIDPSGEVSPALSQAAGVWAEPQTRLFWA